MASTEWSRDIAPSTDTATKTADSSSIGKWNAVCVSACLSTSMIALLLRSYVRAHIKHQWILEDSMCCLACMSIVVYCALMTVTVSKHAGAHQRDLTSSEVQQAVQWFNITSIVYNPAVLSTKIAILLFYRRIFSPIHRTAFDIFLRCLMVILCCFYVSTIIVKIWECNPRARIWDNSIQGTCLSTSSILNTSGLFNLVTDLIILLVPVKAVWNMHLTPKRKLAVVAVFTLGLTAPIFSIIGTVVRLRVSSNPDITYHQPSIQLWAAAEVSTGLICVCAPPLAALFPRPSQPRRRAPSISKGISSDGNARRLIRRAETLNDEGCYGGNPYDERSAAATGKGIITPLGVITGIEGGCANKGDNEKHWAYSSIGVALASMKGSDEAVGEVPAGIMTSVRIEKIYV